LTLDSPCLAMIVEKILHELRLSPDKGGLLERVLVDLLQDLGFRGVRRQQAGSQFGYDVSAYRTSRRDARYEVWKFECKNLDGPIKVEDIAPKLIWYGGSVTIDRFVIVGTSPISNELDFMLQGHTFSMPVSVWTDVELARLIAWSPKAMKRLNLSQEVRSGEPKPEFEHLCSYPAAPISLDIVHKHDPPHAFDYVKTDGGVVKAYNSTEFRLLVIVTNPTEKPFDAYALDAATLDYRAVNSRVLQLNKPKGFVEPVKISFSPSSHIEAGVNVFGEKVLNVRAAGSEYVELLLDSNVRPGLYHLMFTLRGRSGGNEVTRHSPVFVFHVQGPDADVLTLQVGGRHYDSPAEQVLNLPRTAWKMLKREVRSSNKDIYLGPSPHEVINRKPDRTWLIRGVKTRPAEEENTVPFSMVEPSTVIMDLGTPVDEELYSTDDAFDRSFGTDKWQNLLPVQLNRRRAQK
jgi:hypothetical protein